MTIDEDGDIIFESGRTIRPNLGIIGISPELGIYDGYDGTIDWPASGWDEERALTADDMRELADHMIERWTKFKSSLPS